MINLIQKAKTNFDLASRRPKREYTPQIRRRRLIMLILLIIALTVYLLSLPPVARASLLAGLLVSRGLVVLALLFSVITLSLLWSAGQPLDASVFMFFNLRRRHSPWLDRFMWFSTQIGNMASATLIALAAFLLDDRGFALLLMLGILTLWLFVETVKLLTDRARPFNFLETARLIGWREPGLSFPSGHTAQTFFLMYLVINYHQLGLAPAMILYLIAALVGLTRIYIGVHYPRDVAAGAVLGLMWGILGMQLARFL